MHFLQKLTDLPPTHNLVFEDMQRRYQGTLLKYTPEKGDAFPIRYEQKDGHNILFTKENGDLFFVDYQKDYPITPLLPKIGYYNVGGNPIFLIKLPQRQWKHSFCSGIYRAIGLMGKVDTRLTPQQWFELAKETINPQYVSLDDLTHPLFVNIALNRNLCISKINLQSIPSKTGLFYKRYLIGYLDYNSKVVHIIQPTLRQEVIDYFKYQRIKQWNLN